MNRETINPKDEQEWLALRTKDITSTDVAALFGISPWLTEFELWHRKKNANIVMLEPNVRMLWGQRLERSISEGIAEDYKLNIRPMKEYIRIPAWRIGSSFDNAIDSDGLLEVKNVDGLAFKDGWLVDGDRVEAPPHIELQAQHQLLVSGRRYNKIGALIGGNRVTLIKREADLQIHEAIKTKVAQFWASIDANQPPAPDFKEDAKFISQLQGFAEPGKVVRGEELGTTINGLVRDYKEWGEKESSAKAEKEGIKAQILTLIQDAEKVLGDGWTISAGITPPTRVEAYDRKAFRNFKVYIKKTQEAAK